MSVSYRRKQSPEYLRNRAIERKRARGKCRKCGAPGQEVHHKVWRRNGGTDDVSNLRLLCRNCHHDEHREWARSPRRKKPEPPSEELLRRREWVLDLTRDEAHVPREEPSKGGADAP